MLGSLLSYGPGSGAQVFSIACDSQSAYHANPNAPLPMQHSHHRKIIAGLLGLLCAAIPFSPLAHAGKPVPDKGSDFSFKNPQKYTQPDNYAPPMFGDLGGFQAGFGFGGQGGFGGGNFNGGGQGGQGGGNFNGGGQLGGAPISPFRGAYKVAEGESPKPMDRAYVSYNFYGNVEKTADLHREIIGFEKSFLDGRASAGLRLPYLQIQTDSFGSEDAWGDLSVILKYALINNRDTGNVLSIGMAVTAPTGDLPNTYSVVGTSVETVHSTLLQPFVGYIWNSGHFFIQGFTSVAFPTDSRDATILFNDIGFGYRIPLSRGPFTSIVPTLEAHVNTPLNHRRSTDGPQFSDSVDLTAGFHFHINDRVSFSTGVGTPVTSPRLFDIEALARFDFRF